MPRSGIPSSWLSRVRERLRSVVGDDGSEQAGETDGSGEQGDPGDASPQWVRHRFVLEVNRAEAAAAAGDHETAEAAYAEANELRDRYRDLTGRTLDDSGATRRDPEDTNYGDTDRDVVERSGQDTEDWTKEQIAEAAEVVREHDDLMNRAWDAENVRLRVEEVLGIDTITGVSDEDVQRIIDANPDHFAADVVRQHDGWEESLGETILGPDGTEVPIVPQDVVDKIRDPGTIVIPEDLQGRVRFIDPEDPRNPATEAAGRLPADVSPANPSHGMDPDAAVPEQDGRAKSPEERLWERISEGSGGAAGGGSSTSGSSGSQSGSSGGASGGAAGTGGTSTDWVPDTQFPVGGATGPAGASGTGSGGTSSGTGSGSASGTGGDHGHSGPDAHQRYHEETARAFEEEAERQEAAGNSDQAAYWRSKAEEERQKATEQYGEHDDGEHWTEDDQEYYSGSSSSDDDGTEAEGEGVEYTPSGDGPVVRGPSAGLIDEMRADALRHRIETISNSEVNPVREGSEVPTGGSLDGGLPGVADPPDDWVEASIGGPPPTNWGGNAGAIDPSPLDGIGSTGGWGPEDDPLDGLTGPGSGPITLPGASSGGDEGVETLELQESVVADVNFGSGSAEDGGGYGPLPPGYQYALGGLASASTGDTTPPEDAGGPDDGEVSRWVAELSEPRFPLTVERTPLDRGEAEADDEGAEDADGDGVLD